MSGARGGSLSDPMCSLAAERNERWQPSPFYSILDPSQWIVAPTFTMSLSTLIDQF